MWKILALYPGHFPAFQHLTKHRKVGSGLDTRLRELNPYLLLVISTCTCTLLSLILQVSVEEPSDFPSTVQLTLTRSGSFGAAVITWAVTPVSADLLDIEVNTGTAIFPSGSNTTQLEIFISPDDEPEVDELFTVAMVAVSPSSQRISTELVCVNYIQNTQKILKCVMLNFEAY